MKACRCCLKTDGVLNVLENSEEQNFIQEILVQNGYEKYFKESYVCCMCKYLLTKCYKFIKKTLRAQEVLKGILENNNEITNDSLKKIDRQKLDLDIKFTQQENSINFYLWEENGSKNDDAEDRHTTETMHNMFVTKKELGFGSETFITPMDDYPEEVYGHSEIDQLDDLDFIKQEKRDKIEIKIDIQSDDEKPLIDFVKENIECKFDIKQPNEDSDDSSDWKTKPKKTLSRKCKVKTEVGKVKKEVKSKKKRSAKQKRIKKEKRDVRKYPMKCDDCNLIMQSGMEHFHHYLTSHRDRQYPYRKEGQYVCQHCGVVKTAAFHLRQHELTHGEKNVECPECGKRFHNLVRLQRHARRHAPVPRFRCHFCGKGFYAREDIQLHIRTHTGEKPFQCWVCPARFAHKGNVSVHVRNVHQRDAASNRTSDATALPAAASPPESVVSSVAE